MSLEGSGVKICFSEIRRETERKKECVCEVSVVCLSAEAEVNDNDRSHIHMRRCIEAHVETSFDTSRDIAHVHPTLPESKRICIEANVKRLGCMEACLKTCRMSIHVSKRIQ